MKRILLLFLLVFGLSMASDICFSKNTLESSTVLENDCMEQLNALCYCEDNVCEVVPNDELIIKCEGNNCAINFLSFNEYIQVPIVSAPIFEYLCSSMVGSKCTCYDVSGSIKCDIEKAIVTFTYENDGVSLQLSEYSKKLDYCDETIEEEIDVEPENEEEITEEENEINEEEEEEIETPYEEKEEIESSTCCGGMGLILILLGFAFYVKN